MPRLDLYWMDHMNLLAATRTVVVRTQPTLAKARFLESFAQVTQFVCGDFDPAAPICLGSMRRLAQTVSIITPQALGTLRARLVRAKQVEVHDPALAYSFHSKNSLYKTAMTLLWPRPIVSECPTPTRQWRGGQGVQGGQGGQGATLDGTREMEAYARSDGFLSFEDYERHRACMPVAYPAWAVRTHALDECVVCCNAPSNLKTRCNHELCSQCARRLVRNCKLTCPFCKQVQFLGQCTLVIDPPYAAQAAQAAQEAKK